MKALKTMFKLMTIIILLFVVVIYVMHKVEINNYSASTEAEFYLIDNGHHIDIVLYEDSMYNAYGWGSKIFFTEVNDFDDLTFETTIQSLFTEPQSLMRVLHYKRLNPNWYTVSCTKEQYASLKHYINNSYYHNIRYNEDFYYAKGNYNALNTCNTWVNKGLSQAGLKALLYTLTSEPIAKLYKTN